MFFLKSNHSQQHYVENSGWEWEDLGAGVHRDSVECHKAAATAPGLGSHQQHPHTASQSTAMATVHWDSPQELGWGTRDCCPCSKAVQDQNFLSAQLTSTAVAHCKSHTEFFQSDSLRTKVHMFPGLTNHVGSWRRGEKSL